MEKLNNLTDIYVNSIVDFFKKNYPIIFMAFAAGVFVNGFDISNNILSIDKELFLQYNHNGKAWLEQGRWGMFLLNKNIPGVTYPFIAQITGIFFLSLTATLIVYKYDKISIWSKVIFCVLFTTSALFSSMEVFAYQVAYYNIGIFLAVASYEIFIYALKNRKYYNLIPSLSFLTLAIGLYQSTIAFFPSVFALHVFMEYINDKIDIKETLKRMLIVIIFIGIASACHYLVLILTGTLHNEYVNGFFSWGKSPFFDNLGDIFVHTYRSLIGIRQYSFLNLFSTIAILFAAIHIFCMKKQPKYQTSLSLIFLILLFIGSVNVIRFALGSGNLPLRSITSLSVFLAGAIFIYYIVSSKIEKLLITIFLIFTVFYNGGIVTKMYMAGYYVLDADKTLATHVLSRVYDKAPGFYSGETPIAFIGYHDYMTPANPRIRHDDVMGGSFFQWDDGNPSRMIEFMRIVSGVPAQARLANEEEYQKADKYAKGMPAWPHKDSVELYEGIVIVKFAQQKK